MCIIIASYIVIIYLKLINVYCFNNKKKKSFQDSPSNEDQDDDKEEPDSD
jgi:hypothetical protein